MWRTSFCELVARRPPEFRPRPILDALILTDPDGAPRYDELKRAAGAPQELEGVMVSAASLDHLIAMKEAVGRTKDKLMATEYRVLSDETQKSGESA